MTKFTTNWYLYKTYQYSTSKESKTKITLKKTQTHGQKKGEISPNIEGMRATNEI